MVDMESVPLMVSVTVATSLVFVVMRVVMRVVVPGCSVVLSAVIVSVVVGVSVVIGMVVVEGVWGSVVVVFSSDGVTMVVDVVVGVVTGGLVVVVLLVAVSLFSCLFSNTKSTISPTTLKADTLEKHNKNAVIKRMTNRPFIAKRFLCAHVQMLTTLKP